MELPFFKNCLDQGIHLHSLDKPCQYHTKAGFIPSEKISSDRLHPDIQYLLYPYLLATVYGGNPDGIEKFRSPYLSEQSAVSIERTPPDIRERAKNCIKTILSPILPMGRTYHNADIRTDNDSAPFDLGYHGTVCPAAFRSFLPAFAGQYIISKNCADGFDECAIACPDHKKNLVFRIGNSNHSDEETTCYWGKNARIKWNGKCINKHVPNAISLEYISNELRFPCPTLLNVAFAYYLTLARGGELAFYKKSFDAAIFQCPNPDSRVVIDICRYPDKIELKVIDVIGKDCPRHIKNGQSFSLANKLENNAFCLHAFNVLYFYSGISCYLNEKLNVRCMMVKCDASWEIIPEL